MDNLETISQFNSLNIEIEEFKLLRQEIMYYNEAAFKTEINVIAACGIIWAWIFIQNDYLESPEKIAVACSMPILVLLAGYVRYNALKYRVKRLAYYIYCVEQKHFKNKDETAGWEHFVAHSRPNDYKGALVNDAPSDSARWLAKCGEFKKAPYNYKFGPFEKWTNRTWIVAFLINLAALVFSMMLSYA